jgi:undecaprenyl-diphosphatase
VVATDLTALGGLSVLTLFAVVAIAFLLIERKRLSALLLVLGLAGGVALSEGLKALFGRPRPPAGRR